MTSKLHVRLIEATLLQCVIIINSLINCTVAISVCGPDVCMEYSDQVYSLIDMSLSLLPVYVGGARERYSCRRLEASIHRSW